MTSAVQPIRVASWLTVPEADLAQMLLEAEEIPSWLENAALVSWFWHYNNATGGVKLCVRSPDVARTEAVLRRPLPIDEAASPPWQCPKCQAQVEATWTTCWHCGASAEGQEAPEFFEEPSVDHSVWRGSGWAITIIIGLSGPLVLALSHMSAFALLAWALGVGCLLAMQTLQPADAELDGQSRIGPDREVGIDEPPISQGYVRFEQSILRAWHSAVLSVWFFPLALYAVWLLVRLDRPEEPWKPRERRRYFGAWTFSMAWTFLLFFIYLILPLIYSLSRYHAMRG
jgi:hypothetical protein